MLSRFLVGSRLPSRTASRALSNPAPSRAFQTPRRTFSTTPARHEVSAGGANSSSNDMQRMSAGAGAFLGAFFATSILLGGRCVWNVATRTPNIDDTPIAVRRQALKSPNKEMAVTTDGRYLVEDKSGNLVEIKKACGGTPAKWLEGEITRRRLIQDEKEKAERIKNCRKLREKNELVTRRHMEMAGYEFVEKTPNGAAVYVQRAGFAHNGMTMDFSGIPPGAVIASGSSTSNGIGSGSSYRRHQSVNEGGSQYGDGRQNGIGNFDGSGAPNRSGDPHGTGDFGGSGIQNAPGAPHVIGTDGRSNQNGNNTPNGRGSPHGNGGRRPSW